MQEHKKIAFITTIVLLVIFVPFTVLSIVFRVKYINNNPNHEFHYHDKLWFYDDGGNLIGTYDCNFENCGYAQETILDSTYGIKYLIPETTEPKAFISNRYAIISDTQSMTNEPIIYDVVNKTKAGPFVGYKMYFIGLESDYVITINNQNKYGVLQMTSDQMVPKIPNEYDFIALQGKKEQTNKRVSINYFITSKDGQWQLIDSENNEISARYADPIVEYDDSNIITKSKPKTENTEEETTSSEETISSEDEYSFDDLSSYEEAYRLYSYSGTQLVPGNFRRLSFITDNYIGAYTQDNLYYIMDARTHSPVSNSYQVEDIQKVTPTVVENSINLIIENATREVVEIH